MKKSISWYERALAKSFKIDDCLVFNGYLNNKGYGQIGTFGKPKLIHRLSYEHSKGEIPEELVVRHTCDVRNCWNPDHLILGTHKDNSQDMVARGRNTCGLKGHTQTQGSNHGRSKLTEKQVKEIMYLVKTDLTQKEIAKKYSVAQSLVSKLKNNKAWRHVH